MTAKTVKVNLPAEIFDVEVNIPLIHQVVVAQQAAARQGTHATKTRADVRGGGRKPYKQKGTGRARQGSTRAPQFAGGGVVHGPQPRNYDQRTPKKMKAAALRGALSDRARNGRIHVVDSLVTGDVPSTKSALAALTGLAERRHFLVVLERADSLTWLSLRNVSAVHIVAVDQLNTYDVLASDDVVFTQGAYDAFVNGTAASSSRRATIVEPPAHDAAEADEETVVAETEPAGTERGQGAGDPAGDEADHDQHGHHAQHGGSHRWLPSGSLRATIMASSARAGGTLKSSICSGGMNGIVPRISPEKVRPESPRPRKLLARPKSEILAIRPSGCRPIRMFSGLMSRWTMPAACATESARASCAPTRPSVLTSTGWPTIEPSDRPSTNSIAMKRRSSRSPIS